MSLYCPACGKQNVEYQDQHPNGGDLYVAEDMESSTEYYSDAVLYKCTDCDTEFFMSGQNESTT